METWRDTCFRTNWQGLFGIVLGASGIDLGYCGKTTNLIGYFQWEFQDPKKEVITSNYCTIFLAIFWGYIPLHRPKYIW